MYSKSEVGFESPATGMDHCDDCKHYLGGRCEIVSGSIGPGDWCRKFVRIQPMSKNTYSHTFGACAEQKSPAEMAQGRKLNECCAGDTKEHDTIVSKTNGRTYEISLGPNHDGLVPANPFASLAQEGYLHAHPEKLGPEKLAEFDAATKGKKLPKHVKKSK